MANQPDEAERLFEQLIESAPDAMIVTDAGGTIQLINAQAEQLFGYARARLIGAPLETLMPERFRSHHALGRASWEQHPVTGTLGEGLDLAGLRSDGTEFPVEIRISSFETGSGPLTVGIVRDATERRRADDQRTRLIHDLGERVKEVTALHRTAQLLHGRRDPAELLQEVVELFPPAWQYPNLASARIGFDGWEVRTARFAPSPWTQRAEFVTTNGSAGFIEVVYRETLTSEAEGPFLAEERVLIDSLAGLLMMYFERIHAEDERVRLEAAQHGAEEASRAKDEFLAMLSHELRSPLNVMLGWIRMLRTVQLDGAAVSRGMEILERNIKLQATLIEQLLDLSRIVAGKLVLDVCPLDLAELAGFAIDASRPAAQAKGIQLSAVVQPVGCVMADPQRLQQVVANLLTNAVKFTPEGGRIDVRLNASGQTAQLTVTDTGVGIGHDLLPHVFERFRQGDSSVTRQHTGLGLGLAIVRHVVEMHQGTIVAASGGAGSGATFSVTLPLLSAQAGDQCSTTTAETDLDHTLLSGVRVLVVDDQPDERTTLSVVLQQYGAETVEAGSATEALDLLARARPDVLVCDIAMPGEDGCSFIRRVRSLRANAIPAAALTAQASEHGRAYALESGFQTYLYKPVEPATLVVAVAALVHRASVT
jgi:PAS domain S-box-containing protein